MEFLILILGFFLLVIGSNILVEGVTEIAKRFKISVMIISMTIIAIGTSTPELTIACISSIEKNQITLSNNIGSIISTMTLSLGISSFFYPVIIRKSIKKELVKMFMVQLILLIFLYIGNKLDMFDGIIFLLLFIIYIIYLIKKAKNIVSINHEKDIIENDVKYISKLKKFVPNSIITIVLFILFGLLFTIISGNLVVNSATTIAYEFGLSEAFVGATIVSFGTTLPEITTALIAARKKEYDIITGNIVGSGVSNILLIVGLASIIYPIYFTYNLLFQIIFMLLTGSFIYYLSFKSKMKKTYSIILILIYIVFIILSYIISELM